MSTTTAASAPPTRTLFRPWMIILGAAGCSALLISALCNTAGMFLTPVMEETGWSRTAASLYLTIFAGVAAVLQAFVGRILDRFDARIVMSLVLVAFVAAYLWSASFDQLWQWNVFGVIYGICAAFFMYLIQPVLVTRWFRRRIALALSSIGVISGVVGFFINPWVQAMIDADGWRSARLWAGIVTLAVCLPLTLLFVRHSPEKVGIRPYGDTVSAGEASAPATPIADGVPFSRVSRSAAFALLLLFGFFSVIIPSLNQQIPSYAAAAPIGAMAGAFALSILSIIGLPRGPLAGWFFDKVGAAVGNLVAYATTLAGLALLIIDGGQNAVVFYIGVALFSFCFIPLTMGTPVFTRELFGQLDYTRVYSAVTTAVLIAGGIAPFLYAQIFDRTGSYDALLWVGAVLTAAQLVLVVLVSRFARRVTASPTVAVEA